MQPENLPEQARHNTFHSGNSIGVIIMLTQELALNEFYYVDGSLYFKRSKDNQIDKGDLAGGIASHGYIQARLGRGRYLLHRIIFMMHHGYLPKYIDHIDHDRLNNRIENLRECTFSQNRCNTPRQMSNTSGEKGVSWDKECRSWHVRVSMNGKRMSFGRFKNFDEAQSVAIQKRKELHGNFANNN